MGKAKESSPQNYVLRVTYHIYVHIKYVINGGKC